MLLGIIKTFFEHLTAFCRKQKSNAQDIQKMRKLNIILQHTKQHHEQRLAWAAPQVSKGAKKQIAVHSIGDNHVAEISKEENSERDLNDPHHWKNHTETIRQRIRGKKGRSRNLWLGR